MKKVLITGGPTNEYIDEVMKITNMSSGRLAVQLASEFLSDGYLVTLLLTKNIVFSCNKNMANLKLVRFETTDELMSTIDVESKEGSYDIVIHSAAVADYKPEYSFRLEDMATEIKMQLNEKGNLTAEEIFAILKNPKCKVNDDTKISSVEPNLTVKLGLTPKIIATLRDKFPDAYICGFKLLENVPENELIDAAVKQIQKCNTDLVFANDLAELRKGNIARLVVTKHGYDGIKVDGPTGIFHLVKIATTKFE